MRLKTSADDSVNYRYSGILVHPTSFPSPYGIGDFGKGAYDFIDFLEAAGQHLWQILPLNPITSHGNSPYQGFSVFAGEPLLISPELLKARGLLREEDLREIPGFDPVHVDYDAVREYKYPLFRKAYEAFCLSEDEDLQAEYDEFCTKNEVWLSDYSLFMALKEEQEGLPWTKWPESLRNLTEENRAFWTEKLEDEMVYHTFLQFCFYSQWEALKKYANDRGIAIIGDIPIFVSPDGADVWANRELFQVNEKGYPSAVAGVPPDYFSATGQKWGNPLYNWAAHKKEGYRWWISRVRHLLEQADYVRVDHFRGFEAYWEVPVDAENAISGEWKKGPGEELFRAIHDALGEDLPIFAEDLGLITPEVEKLRDTLGFPGMRVLQFAFDGGESTFLPHQFNTRNCICYTGTHDNNTTAGWYNSASEYSRDKVRRYMNTDASSISWDFIRICLGSIARYAIFPIQDVLKLGEEGRMNVPGVADGNWAWRYRDGDLNSGMAQGLRQMTELFGR
ncbi:4-alpha-glucanotransferase [Lachnoclostridium sp. An138]|uniref:4-alpha-glucanotransferase n=1 Tax=Lachnoclostridium sp. An138 TaxID=1965560 RepID=UPI000B389906|nr:4-alpha-glucanotransferase [Lachnoclostridium sp. An138]OUQ19997.1 4-alpha-glucanotransferase [Lachnoclostridium sp. An138]